MSRVYIASKQQSWDLDPSSFSLPSLLTLPPSPLQRKHLQPKVWTVHITDMTGRSNEGQGSFALEGLQNLFQGKHGRCICKVSFSGLLGKHKTEQNLLKLSCFLEVSECFTAILPAYWCSQLHSSQPLIDLLFFLDHWAKKAWFWTRGETLQGLYILSHNY